MCKYSTLLTVYVHKLFHICSRALTWGWSRVRKWEWSGVPTRKAWSSDLGVGWNLEQQKCELGCPLTPNVRYRSPMDLQQVCPAPSSSTTPFPSQSLFYFHHISNTPLFIPVPLVSPFVPMFPVSLISISMSLWSSHLSHIVFSPIPVFPCFMLVPFVPSPWPSQANPAA